MLLAFIDWQRQGVSQGQERGGALGRQRIHLPELSHKRGVIFHDCNEGLVFYLATALYLWRLMFNRTRNAKAGQKMGVF